MIEIMTECRVTELMDDLAEKIKAEHQEVSKALGKGLEHAIKAGEFLNQAKGHADGRSKLSRRKWSDWLAENCPDIPRRTVNVYRQLAENKHLFKNWQRAASLMGEDLSIRGALKLIPPKKKRPKAAAETTKAAVEQEPAPPRSPTIENMLSDLAPDELFTAVTATWDADQVEKLAKLLAEHMRSLKHTAPPPPQPPGQIERRA